MTKTGKGKVSRKMWIVILSIVVVIAVGALGGILADAPGRREIADISLLPLDFKSLRDGTYTGEYKGTKSHFRDTKVEVVVSEGKIIEAKILKGALDKEGKPSKLTGGHSIEDLFNNVIKSHTLQVDVISGATLTSKAHLKALENALEQAQVK